MKAWILDQPHQPLRLADVEVPTPGPGQALVKVRGTGLCQSDVSFIDGVLPMYGPLPIILGHEPAGTIAALGEGVSGWQVGDAVAAANTASDCPGATSDGAFSEYFLVTAARLVKLPHGMDWGQAAAATDAGITSYTGVVVDGQVKAGDRVGIVGLGGLGMTGARIAVIKGATVYGVSRRESVWATAREQGVEKVVKDVSELEGMDLDVIVDFAGFSTTTAGALKAVRHGGRVSVVGLGTKECTFEYVDLVVRRISVHGSSPLGETDHLHDVISMIRSGDLTIRASEVSFDDIPDGLDRLRRGDVIGRLYATLPE